MIDDSIDDIDLQAQNIDLFRNQLIVKGMYDHYFEKEKYLLKQYQILDYLQEMLVPKYINQSHNFMSLMINFNRERFNNNQNHDKETQFITIFTYSLRFYCNQIYELEYLYKLISASDRLGLSILVKYFKIRKLIFSYIYDHRNTIIFLDQYNLQFEEWSGIICRIFGPEQITQIGNQIRKLNQEQNKADKIWKNGINSLEFIKICMKYSRKYPVKSKTSSSFSPIRNAVNKSEKQILQSFYQHQETQNQKFNNPIPNEKVFSSNNKNSFIFNANNSFSNKKEQISNSSVSKSPQKSQQNKKNNSSVVHNLPSKSEASLPKSNKADIMNQTPRLFYKPQQNKIEKPQKTEQSTKQPQFVTKDGVVINQELAIKYEELEKFTKKLQFTISQYIANQKKVSPQNEEELSKLSKQLNFDKYVENPYMLLQQSVNVPQSIQKDYAMKQNENSRY
ncbi:hypothetical protein TTHERM_00590260 (macronuclear) [Tetrahymena thermophila SB210]|uniref:Uncharacterized protein n=1 Tax=Tetrahymena thermophila (strain SB210) TaxID=312017 RepID=I7M8U5_TETTS|nr:hypothetical protein TTHERM_00590260 [Tetrahymena thermophila SB210]EAR99688.2 hypothetical protein TTHERM_00590260 [Tetrahymena thermophila SB210]|eukprot:XP_001019933.2 hypothetical protein TTHERM_00590260 [Tetrahymena thermophila SB210]